MTKDEIIEMARQAGMKAATAPSGTVGDYLWGSPYQIETFAKLVAAKEREACLKICEAQASTNYWEGADVCAEVIRARGEA